MLSVTRAYHMWHKDVWLVVKIMVEEKRSVPGWTKDRGAGYYSHSHATVAPMVGDC